MSEKIKTENIERIINHWVESSDDNFNSMCSMLETKHYDWALFVGHLALEKLLKALHIKKHGRYAPFTHDLLRLARLNELDVTTEQREWLDEITLFNLNTRYIDFKKRFYFRCTSEFSAEWADRIEKLRIWLKAKF
ncbi:MAG: HEPN domain-containing protein [Bacteroidia bacterium]|nr:HEPN domain-containing protein [Bacteroidia bacterium]